MIKLSSLATQALHVVRRLDIHKSTLMHGRMPEASKSAARGHSAMFQLAWGIESVHMLRLTAPPAREHVLLRLTRLAQSQGLGHMT